MFKEDLYEINNEIDKINQRIDSLCNAVNTNIASLQTIIDVMQDNDYVDSITPIVEGGETVGYEIVFTQSGSVKIYHGKKGETGATGHTPVIGVKQAEDGRWYWTVDGAYLLDGEGDKILAEAIDGEDGATGADGITPQLKVEGDYWYISYDNKATWERLGKATGEAGKDGDSMFQSVNYNDEYVELVLIDGTVLRIPTWASHMLLVDEIAKINSNISAIQAAIEALESNDYVQKVTPVKDEDGNVIGYTLQFAFTGDVTIYHGEDGKDGEDGEDGKDGEDGEDGKDGYTPVIGARQHPDGNWYWTVDTEWLLDTNGNKVKTTGEDGTSGITPELKIQDDYWYVSYDKGQTWTKLGKAKGEDGAAGSAGTAGDAFFKGVDTSDEYYVKFTLADGTVIKIPTWKAYQELADLVDQLNTNFKSLNDIVVGIQNNDYITGYTPIVDPQTNEEIGYTLHFAKSGDITIYHGKTGQDGVAPDISIQEHPKYGLCWTYNGEFIIDPGTGKPVALPSDGKNGKDGVSPKLKIEDGEWWVSYNNGSSWTSLGQATGDTGATGGTGDSFFKSIEPEYAKDANGNVLKDELGRPIVAYIVMTLAGENEGDEVTYKVPTEYVTDDLNKRLAAIEAQFSTISTIVNALQNAEYIKDVVELYEGPALVGYEITFVKYAIGADGKLTETTRKSTIRNGGAGAAGTVVAAQYDEATDTWYWTLDGQPLKDKDGNYVAINGRPGQAGVTPKMQINKDTNEWEVSYDNGTTWTSTGVKATGPQGPQGNPGQGGTNGDSFFAGVSKDGDYWVFELVSGEKIMVPTAEAFASLAGRVAALEKSAESILSLVNGKKYIESCEPFSNDSGSGYHLVLVSLNAETGEATKEDCFIYNGIAGNTPVVGLRQDEATGDWYWTVDGEDLLVDGKPVKANGPEPSFHIDQNGHLWVNVNGNEKDLGNVIGAGGGSGADASILVEEVKDDAGKPTGELIITFMSGTSETGKISVPSWAKFVELQNAVNELNTYVTALQTAVKALEDNDYVTAITDLKDEEGNVIGYTLTFAKSGEKVIYHGKKGDKGDDAIAPKVRINEETNEWEISTDGGESWTSTGVVAVGPKGEDGVTPKFKIENGQWYVSYDNGTTWGDPLGQATGSTGATGSSGASFFESVSEEKDAEGNITHIVIVVPDETPEDYSDNTKYRIPTAFTYAKLEKQIDEANSNIEALQAAVAALENNDYVKEIIDIVENDVVVGYKLIFAISGEKSIYHGKKGDKGDDAIAPKIRINENTKEWEISTDDGESWTSTGIVAVGPKGEDGATPKFKIENGYWYVSFDNGTSWSESLGQATGDKGETGSTGTSGASFFESVSEMKDDNGNVTHIVITVPDNTPDNDEDNVKYVIPTQFEIERIEALVESYNDAVTALSDLVNKKDFVTSVTPVTDEEGRNGWKITFTKSEPITFFNGKDGETPDAPTVTIGDNGNWFVNGEDTGSPSTGKDAVTPKFKIEGGYWCVSYDAEHTEWEQLLDENKNPIPATGESGASFFNNVTPIAAKGADGNDLVDENGKPVYAYLKLTDPATGAEYMIPTQYEIKRIENLIGGLEEQVKALTTLVYGQTYIVSCEPLEDGSGFELKTKSYDSENKKWTEASVIIKHGTTPDTPKIGLRPGKPEEGESDKDWYWTVGDNDLLVNGNPVKANGTNGATPSFKIGKAGETGFDAGVLYYTFDNPITEETQWIPLQNVVGAPGAANVTVDGDKVVIDLPSGDTVVVPKYYETPIIEFSTAGTTFEEGTLKLGTASSGTVTCIITGSFPEGYEPQIYTTCEGHFTSTASDVDGSGNTYTTTITVSATTAYVGDKMSGKLTVYCPYYGNTGIGQLNLTAEGANNLVVTNVEPTVKEGNDTEVRISIGGVNETVNTNAPLRVEAVNDDGTQAKWLKRGSVNTDSEGNIIQKLEMEPYVVDVTSALQQRSSRRCTLTVYTPAGRMVGRQILKQMAIIDLSKLSDKRYESANCYVISAPGRYMLPAQKGNSTTTVLPTDASELSFTQIVTDVQDNSIVDQGILKFENKDYIVFDVNYDELSKTTTKIDDGNTVMALKNGSTTLWSWHLWFCPGKLLSLGELDDQKYTTGHTMLNRNLGASSSTEAGAYYKWGCKEPFINNDYQGAGSISYEKSWQSTTKQIADPCPPGYKVPTNDVWLDKDDWYKTDAASVQIGTSYIYNVSSPNVMYPYSEFLLADLNLDSNEKYSMEYNDPEFFFEAPGYETDGTMTVNVVYNRKTYPINLPQMAQDYFYDIDMEINLATKEGRVWSTNGFLSYEYRTLDLENISLDAFRNAVTIKSYKHKRRTLKSYTISNIKFALAWPPFTYDSEPIWDEYVEVNPPQMSDPDKISLLEKLYTEINAINGIEYSKPETIDKSHGYQVRCMKE